MSNANDKPTPAQPETREEAKARTHYYFGEAMRGNNTPVCLEIADQDRTCKRCGFPNDCTAGSCVSCGCEFESQEAAQ